MINIKKESLMVELQELYSIELYQERNYGINNVKKEIKKEESNK